MFLTAALLLLSAPRGFPLETSLDISQYAHTAWKVRDEFTKSLITSIAQTPDGYLWLGTELGLYRFDGARAVPWQPNDNGQLPSSYITALLAARDGTLWIGTRKGLAGWKDGKLTNHPEVTGNVFALLQVRDGTVWLTATEPGRVCAIRGGGAQCDEAGRFGSHALALYEDREGNLWVWATTGLWRWKPGPPKQYPFPPEAIEANSLIEDDAGTLLLATVTGLKQLVGGKIRAYALPTIRGWFRPIHFLRSRDGSLWVGSDQGLWRLHEGKTESFRVADGLSDDHITAILEDREGNIWVSTKGGLDRFRDYAVRRVSTNQGLSSNDAYSIQATHDDAIWIGTSDRLNRWKDGQVTVYDSRGRRGLGGPRDDRDLNVGAAVTEVANSGLEGTPRSLGLDGQGRLYVSTNDGIFHFEGNRFIRVSGAAGGNIWSIIGDDHGKLWVNDATTGLFHFTPGEAAQAIKWSRFGQKGLGPESMLADRSSGGLWLGFNETGISYFKDGQVGASYTVADGLGSGRVNQLRFDSRGTLWAATEGGLSRILDRHIETLSSKNGLPCDTVHWSIEDDDHAVWVYMPCGLARIDPSEWSAWVDDPRLIIKTTVYANSDGVGIVGAYGGYGPHVTKAPDGKIWFVTYDGIGLIDPRHLPYNKLPPPVHIEQITADGKTFDPAQGLRLPPRVQHLDIDYAALSLVVPEKNRFRFKLEGYDRDWRDVGNRRQAFYTNLPPRNYRFFVKACNNSGVWNEEGAFLDFSIAPAYYQTNWFRALCVAAFLALLWAVYQLRLRQVAREYNVRLEERVSERTRVARELHDTLLQSFQGLLMRFQAVSNELLESEPKQELDEAIDRAARAITEGRDAVQGLRSSVLETNDLAAGLGTLGKELAAADNRHSEFTIQVEGTQRHLHPIVRDEVYSVAGEALRNAFSHANSQHIEVEIRYDERQFRLRVRDDGKGIDPQLLMEHGRLGHFGLRGMLERANRVGGKLSVWSSDPRTGGARESGTEVELRIPAAHAYASYRTPRRRWWLAEKFSGKDYEMKS